MDFPSYLVCKNSIKECIVIVIVMVFSFLSVLIMWGMFAGVFAKTLLNKRLQFGPLQAKRIPAGNQQVALEEKIKERYA